MGYKKSDLLSTHVPKNQHEPRVLRDGRSPLTLDPANPGSHVHHNNDRTAIGEHNSVHGYTGGMSPKPKHGGGLTPSHGAMLHRDRDTGKTYVGITPTSVALAIETAP